MSAVLIGILLDVSGSMRTSIGDKLDEEGGSWIRSVFQVIDDLVKHDVSNDNAVFAIAFGGRKGNETFDILGTLQDAPDQIKRAEEEAAEKHKETIDQIKSDEEPPDYESLEEIFEILERNGAKYIRERTTCEAIQKATTNLIAQPLLATLKSDKNFAETIVNMLPRACRSNLSKGLLSKRQGTEDEILEIVRQATDTEKMRRAMDLKSKCEVVLERARKETISKTNMKKWLSTKFRVRDVSVQSIFKAHDAAKIIHGCVDDKDLTKERAQELLQIVEPLIYEGTPLYAALNGALRIFSESRGTHAKHRRLLFVLSDGDPGDKGNIERIQSQLVDEQVTVVSCFIQHATKVKPRKLFNVAGEQWENGARFLFEISSKVPTELVIREIFIRKGWEIDVVNNETRLFAHVNHPDHIKDVCDLARNTVCFQDALADVLVSVDLDIYINQQKSGFAAPKQEGETCYANAIATVMHLAMHRTLGRVQKSFEDLRGEIIDTWGKKGANTFRTMERECKTYNSQFRETYKLQFTEVDVNKAMEAIVAKRPVLARFGLTEDQWKSFRTFYRNNPNGVLKPQDLPSNQGSANTQGHAVVLTSFNSEYLYLMNSWGDDWADKGFFRIENDAVLGLEFMDVKWTWTDLSKEEKKQYDIHASEVAGKLMKSLRGLQVGEFPCPKCNKTSKVTEFRGTLSRAKCPKCKQQFPCTNNVDGNILALNMHLTSLAQDEGSVHKHTPTASTALTPKGNVTTHTARSADAEKWKNKSRTEEQMSPLYGVDVKLWNLDEYINQDIPTSRKNIRSFEYSDSAFHSDLLISMSSQHQESDPSCENAMAVVIHLAMVRAKGRPCAVNFSRIREKALEHRNHHGNTFSALANIIDEVARSTDDRQMELNYKIIDVIQALGVVVALKRPVIAIGNLTKDQWHAFNTFYESDPAGILKSEDLAIATEFGVTVGNTPSANEDTTAQFQLPEDQWQTTNNNIIFAAVLIGFDRESLYLMSSWGDRWGHEGFFRIENAEMLNFEFVDVYWTRVQTRGEGKGCVCM